VDGEATESAKGGTLNRRELINAVASTVDADAKEVERFLSGLTDTITSTVARGEQVAISGFAKFAKVERAARMGRNPATGEQIHIKASKKARITPLKAFKDAVMGGAAGGARKATAKKGPATKKAAAKKGATAKKAVAKKTTTKRSTAKKSTAKRASARR
jgi:DNA-binding protein HU-beta